MTLNKLDSLGRNALCYTLFSDNLDVIKYILSVSVFNKEFLDRNQRSYLHLATIYGSYRCIDFILNTYFSSLKVDFLSYGAWFVKKLSKAAFYFSRPKDYINAFDCLGLAPLHYASVYLNNEIYCLLTAFKGDEYCRSKIYPYYRPIDIKNSQKEPLLFFVANQGLRSKYMLLHFYTRFSLKIVIKLQREAYKITKDTLTKTASASLLNGTNFENCSFKYIGRPHQEIALGLLSSEKGKEHPINCV